VTTKYQRKKPKYNIILVCHTCLKELVIPNEEFDPWAPTMYEPAKGWVIPQLAQEVTQNRGAWNTSCTFSTEVPASNVRCYCPEHADNVEEVREELEEKE
jgi:uncharacterized protein YgiM (DUF1202 family)